MRRPRKIKRTVSKKKEVNWKLLFFVTLIAFVGVSVFAIHYKINTEAEIASILYGWPKGHKYNQETQDAQEWQKKYGNDAYIKAGGISHGQSAAKLGEKLESGKYGDPIAEPTIDPTYGGIHGGGVGPMYSVDPTIDPTYGGIHGGGVGPMHSVDPTMVPPTKTHGRLVKAILKGIIEGITPWKVFK
jgi:uncharacterized protein YxeA